MPGHSLFQVDSWRLPEEYRMCLPPPRRQVAACGGLGEEIIPRLNFAGQAGCHQRWWMVSVPGVLPMACQSGRYMDSTCGGGIR